MSCANKEYYVPSELSLAQLNSEKHQFYCCSSRPVVVGAVQELSIECAFSS